MSDDPVRQRLSSLSDDELVERVRAGSAAAVAALFERHHRALLSFCRHMLGRRAAGEAAVVESFRQALATLRKHDRPVHFSALLFAIARNRCGAAAPDKTVETAGLDPEVARDHELSALLAALGDLPPDQRAALLLTELDQHSREDVAAILGCPGDKVDALVAAARTALAGAETPPDWSCAHARTDLAAGGGAPRREGALRRALAIVLSVVPSDRLRAPEARETSERGSDRPSAGPDAPPGRRVNRTAAGAGAIAALVAGVIFVAIAVHGRGAPAPAAIAPPAGGAAVAKGGGGSGAGERARAGAGVAPAPYGGGLIVHIARTARRVADEAPSR